MRLIEKISSWVKFSIILFLLWFFFLHEEPDPVAAWLTSPGTQGFINLNAVKEAFNQEVNLDTFEQRINEIFEGDGLIRLKTETSKNHFILKACEDLDFNNSICTPRDDTLFTIAVSGNQAVLTGFGVNSYYRTTWNYPPDNRQPIWLELDDDLPSGHTHHSNAVYFISSSNDSSRQRQLIQQRERFRSGMNYRQQIILNSQFEQKVTGNYRHSSRFAKAMKNISPARADDLKAKGNSRAFQRGLVAFEKSNQNAKPAWKTRQHLAKTRTIRSSSFTHSTRAASYSSRSFRSSSGGGMA
ncbi:hypothetical protein ACQZV8_13895 [Magnetococcales bacterium HHB-1]